ncbi:hypothetical protein R6Q57_023761 [Mikania cordata]
MDSYGRVAHSLVRLRRDAHVRIEFNKNPRNFSSLQQILETSFWASSSSPAMNSDTQHITPTCQNRKRKASDNNDDVNHSQPQLLHASPIGNLQQQPPTASNSINDGADR